MATPRSSGSPGSPGSPGLGVDVYGGPVIDPTANVLSLVEAANKRQDDLRSKDREISDIQHKHEQQMADLRARYQEKISELREAYQEKMGRMESSRIDSIRQVDREEVAKTAVAANTAITTLAKQTTDLQQTLAKQVTDTAAAQEARNSAQYSDINKRLSALELSSSEGKGKQTASDPQMADLITEMRSLRDSRAIGTGKGEGLASAYGWIVSAIIAIGAVIAIWSKLP